MGIIRDSINTITIMNDNQEDYIDEEVEYYYNCNKCAFNLYMTTLGFEMDMNNCPIDCTLDNWEYTNEMFKFIAANTFENSSNAVLYTGKCKRPKNEKTS